MDLMNYIENGRGRGLKCFAIFSLLFCLLFGVVFGNVFNGLAKESMSAFIQQVPTIEIKAGKVVSPLNSYVSLPFSNGENNGFVLDTLNPNPEMTFDNGIYLTTDTVYVKSGNDIQAARLAEAQDMTITPATLSVLLSKIIAVISVVFALVAFFILWLGYALLYVAIKLFFLVLGRTTCPYVRGRTIFVAWGSILTLDLILFVFGYGFSPLVAFALALILALVIIFKTPLHSMDLEESLVTVTTTPAVLVKPVVKKAPAQKIVKKSTPAKPVVKKIPAKSIVKKTIASKGSVKKTVKK